MHWNGVWCYRCVSLSGFGRCHITDIKSIVYGNLWSCLAKELDFMALHCVIKSSLKTLEECCLIQFSRILRRRLKALHDSNHRIITSLLHYNYPKTRINIKRVLIHNLYYLSNKPFKPSYTFLASFSPRIQAMSSTRHNQYLRS
jgi:hypothetical protein